MEDGDVVYACHHAETLDPSKRTVIRKLQKSLYGLRSTSRRWQDHLEDILRKCGFCLKHARHLLVDSPVQGGSLVFDVDDLLLAGTRQTVTEILSELKRDLELKSSEVTTKPTRYLGRTLVRTKDGFYFGVDASYVEDMLEEFNMSALKGTPALRWERRETKEEKLPANELNVYRQLVGKLW